MEDKSINSPNLAKLLDKTHADKWVAFSSGYDKVVAFSHSLESLMSKVQGRDVVVIRTLPAGAEYIP